jgi:hypothetical protein
MGRIREKNRWRCGACCAVNLEPDLPTAPSPFDPTDTLTACPNCKQCNDGFELLCDEPGCNVVAGCGWPTGDDQDEWGGYRNTCSLHMQQKTGADPQTIQEAAAELRRQHARIAELQARIKTMAEEHADELMVAHMDGMRAEQAIPGVQWQCGPQANGFTAPQADSVLEDAAQVEIDLFNDLNRIYGNTLTAYAKELCRLGYRKTNAARKQGANHD